MSELPVRGQAVHAPMCTAPNAVPRVSANQVAPRPIAVATRIVRKDPNRSFTRSVPCGKGKSPNRNHAATPRVGSLAARGLAAFRGRNGAVALVRGAALRAGGRYGHQRARGAFHAPLA